MPLIKYYSTTKKKSNNQSIHNSNDVNNTESITEANRLGIIIKYFNKKQINESVLSKTSKKKIFNKLPN